MNGKRLYRSSTDKKIAGVCSGFAEYFGLDPVLVRIAWAALVIYGGSGLVLYLICWLVIPVQTTGT